MIARHSALVKTLAPVITRVGAGFFFTEGPGVGSVRCLVTGLTFFVDNLPVVGVALDEVVGVAPDEVSPDEVVGVAPWVWH